MRPAASGKGTLAKRLADHLGFHCLDTGLLYRAVARDVAARYFRLDDCWAAVATARSLDPATLGDPAPEGAPPPAMPPRSWPRSRRSGQLCSNISAASLPASPARSSTGAISAPSSFPDAKVKIYVTATPEVRAKRRFAELEGRDKGVVYETVLADIIARDARDSGRSNSPMVMAARCDVARHEQLRYRGRIRRRRRIDQEEDRPVGAHETCRFNF